MNETTMSPSRSWEGHDWNVWWNNHKTKLFLFFSVLIGLGIGVAAFFTPSLDLKQSLEAGIAAWFSSSVAIFTACTKLDFYFSNVELKTKEQEPVVQK